VYPMFLAIALLLENKKKAYVFLYFAVSFALLLFATILFTRGYFVA